MKPNDNIEVANVFAGSFMQAEMVKNLLENVGIKSYLLDEISFPGGSDSVTVVVSNLDYKKAKVIVDEYEENLKI